MTQPSNLPTPSSTALSSRHRPLLPVVLGLAFAILLAERSAHHIVWGLALCSMLVALCLSVACRWRQRRGTLLAVSGVLLLGYAFTLWSAVYLPADHVSRHLVAHPVTLEGRLLRAEPASPGRITLDIAAQTLRDATEVKHVSGLVRLTAYDFEPAVQAGDLVRVQRLRLRQPSSFRNPGAFDYGRYLARRGIHATASLSTAERLEVVHRPPSWIMAPLARFKAALADHITRVMAEPQAAITQGMVFGLRSRLTPEVQEAFAASGTAHLMSVSGLHVGFVYAAAFFLLKPCFVRLRFQVLGRLSGGPRPSKLAATVSLLVVVGYACLVGSNFPTIRATLMIATYVIAYLFDRDGDPWHTTALAALLILAVHPFSLFDIGFQLSFAGVLAILYAQRLLHPPAAPDLEVEAPLSRAARLQITLHDALWISVCASVGTAPLMLYYFQRLPLIAPLANIVVVPLASLVVPLALVASFIGQLVPPLGDLLLSLTGMLVTAMYTILRSMAAIPYAAPRLGGVSLPWIGLAYGLLLLLPSVRVSRLSRWGVVGGSLVLVLWLAWPALFPDGRGELQVTFLDVGHGDASFIRFPRGTTMLIDGGGSARGDFDVGERVVAPFLWYTRVRRVDYVVATHPQADHAKGLPFIFKNFRVRQFWDNGAPLRSSWYSTLREQAVTRGQYRDIVAAGLTRVTIDGVHLEVLHPTLAFQPRTQPGRPTPEDRGENNRSLVLKLIYGDVSFLFTGDIEQEAEAFLVQTGRDVDATVLKIPHHGSRTSSSEAFLRAVSPRVAVFSVQRESRFGHPAPLVLARYESIGAAIWRTDHDGAITVRTDGHALRVEPYGARPAAVTVQARPPRAGAATPSLAGGPPGR